MYPAFPPLPLDTTAPSRPSLIIITTSVLTWTQRVEVERFYKLSPSSARRIILLKRYITKIWIMNETLILHDIIKMSTEADCQTVFNELTLDYPLVPIYTSPGWSEILRNTCNCVWRSDNEFTDPRHCTSQLLSDFGQQTCFIFCLP